MSIILIFNTQIKILIQPENLQTFGHVQKIIYWIVW